MSVDRGFAASCALAFLRVDLRPTLVINNTALQRTDHDINSITVFANDAFLSGNFAGLDMVYHMASLQWPSQAQHGSWVISSTEIEVEGAEELRVLTWTSSRKLQSRVCSVSNQRLGSSGKHDFHSSRILYSFDGWDFNGSYSGEAPELDSGTVSPCTELVADANNGPKTPPQNPLKELNQFIAALDKIPPDPGPVRIRSSQAWSFTDWPSPAEPEPCLPPWDEEHYKNLSSVDWSLTPLGYPQTWPVSVRTTVDSIMGNPYPTALYIGPEFTIVYNTAWKSVTQEKDPSLLGKRFVDGLPEMKDSFIPLLEAAYYGGKCTHQSMNHSPVTRNEGSGLFTQTLTESAKRFLLHRDTGLEERYFDYTLIPIIGEDGRPVAVQEQALEHTQSVISSRRFQTLRRLANCLGRTRDMDKDEFWDALVTAFDRNPVDSPFLMVYRTVTESESEDCVQHLRGTVGVQPGGHVAPKYYHLDEPHDGEGLFAKEMRLAREENVIVTRKLSYCGLDECSEIQHRGYEDKPTTAAVIPIQVPGRIAQGFLIIGLNPRQPFNDEYKTWLEFIKKELATTTARMQLSKEEITRVLNEEKQEAAHKQAVELQEQLSRRTKDLRHSELLFTRTAETIPVGLALMDADGDIYFTNDAYRELAVVNDLPATQLARSWRYRLYSEDAHRVLEGFNKAISSKSALQQETRMGRPGEPWKYWISAAMVPQIDEVRGEVNGWILTVVDITSIKLNEEYQRQLSHQACERRRQQENFIDMFSHELRNPFSATMQCAEGILTSLTAHQSNGEDLDIEDVVDSAQTILVCVQHQMRIIDDVLTLSKLDSMLLSVVPVDVQIDQAVKQMMKIFQPELKVKGIKNSFIIEDPYRDLQVDWVKADTSRFSQVLINLMTNAIKFTSLQSGNRKISVRLGASLERPTAHGTVEYVQDQILDESLPERGSPQEWGSGDAVYIQVMVQDSGIGVSKEWQTKLFKRFEQVPRTHVTYGGSGLGLYISRRLCLLQGGRIGISSEEGKGSAFAFYIKTRRVYPRHDVKESKLPTEASLAARRASVMDLTSSVLEDPEQHDFQHTPRNSISKDRHRPRSPHYHISSTSPRRSISYRVLIVEDNIINQEVLRRQLKKASCVTYVANNGAEALDFVKASSLAIPGGTHLDLLLMDNEMPKMDGSTAARKIREMEQNQLLIRHVPILGISANARPEQVKQMTDAGMDDAISKPFGIQDLMGRFKDLLDRVGVEPATETPPYSSTPRSCTPQPNSVNLEPQLNAISEGFRNINPTPIFAP